MIKNTGWKPVLQLKIPITDPLQRIAMPIEKKELDRMLQTAIAAAQLAGRKAMDKINSITASVKNNNELVTQADAACQKIIIDTIRKAFPDAGFIAEEGDEGKMFREEPKGTEKIWWVIDPIDGTNNFVHKILSFTVSIAAMHQGYPIAGVIYEPTTGLMFTAVKEQKAKLNGRQISAGEEELNRFASIGLDGRFDEGVPEWACSLMEKTKFRNFGSTALHIAYVASGSLAASLISYPKLWDIAAGALIAEQAGAIVSDWKGERIFPVDLETYNSGKFQVLAANKKAHPQIIKMINKQRKN